MAAGSSCQKIGRLTLQNSWLKKNLVSTLTHAERVALLESPIPEQSISLTDQAKLLGVSRASLYYKPRPVSERELAIKRRLDEWYTQRPSLGSRKVVELLSREGLPVSRHTIRAYRREMGLETVYPKPRTSQPGGLENKVFPYLLRNLCIARSNQVWGTDITYIRLAQGWMYLVVFLDWYSRFVVAWELADTLEIDFVLQCSKSALVLAIPEIVNSDQGSHFTSEQFTQQFQAAGTKISMDSLRLRETEGGGTSITFLRSACGERSNMRKFIFQSMRTRAKPDRASAVI